MPPERSRPPEELAPLPRSVIPIDVEGTEQGQSAHEWRMRVYTRDIAFSLRILTERTPSQTLGFELGRSADREVLPDNPPDPRDVDDATDRHLARAYLRDIAVSLRELLSRGGNSGSGGR